MYPQGVEEEPFIVHVKIKQLIKSVAVNNMADKRNSNGLMKIKNNKL